MEKAARELHDIQERWKTAAEAPRAQAQTLWHRYRQAADPIQAKAREFFAARAVERETNLKIKLALCERAEALADSTDWIKTAEEMKKLQAEWQASGPVPRPETRVVWKRFRDACDRFFSRRNEDLAQRKEVWSANQAKKEALCARAEELADVARVGEGGVRAAPAAGRLEDGRPGAPHASPRRCGSASGPRPIRSSIATSGATRSRSSRARPTARRSIAELEAFLPAEGAEPWRRRICSRRCARCARAGTSPRPRSGQGADPLSGRFVSAMERVLTSFPEPFKGTELDVEASRQRMEKLVARLETLRRRTHEPKQDSPQDLAARLREALASNTIGGRAGEESKWRGMADEVRQAQSSFARLVPVPGETGGSSPSGSTRRATGSSISTAARSRSSPPRRRSAGGPSGRGSA